MKKRMKFGIFAIMLASSVMLTGCGKDAEKEKAEQAKSTLEKLDEEWEYQSTSLYQNDYRGSVYRSYVLQKKVLDATEYMKSGNNVIREENPNSYWNVKGYQEFVTNFFTIPIIYDTEDISEESVACPTWADTVARISADTNSFTVAGDEGNVLKSGITISRNEKDDYTIKGLTWSINSLDSSYNGTLTYRILYDASKDWAKAYAQMPLFSYRSKNINGTAQIYEVRRIDNNTYVLQTSTERLLVVLKPVEEDTDIRLREIKEFYYSRLRTDIARSTFETSLLIEGTSRYAKAFNEFAEKFNEEEKMGTIHFSTLEEMWNKQVNEVNSHFSEAVNEWGDLADRYGENDSIFYASAEDLTNPKLYVFRDTHLQQAFAYKDGVLVVANYNKLNDTYENPIYIAEGSDAKLKDELNALITVSVEADEHKQTSIGEKEPDEEGNEQEMTTTTKTEMDGEVSTVITTEKTEEMTENGEGAEATTESTEGSGETEATTESSEVKAPVESTEGSSEAEATTESTGE